MVRLPLRGLPGFAEQPRNDRSRVGYRHLGGAFFNRWVKRSISRGCYGLRESKMRLCKTLKKMNSSGDWEKAVTNEPNQDDGACVAGLTLAEMSVTLPIIRVRRAYRWLSNNFC